MSDIDSEYRSQNMSDKSKNGRNFSIYFPDVTKLFNEFKNNYRQGTNEQSPENIATKNNWKADCYDDKKCKIDKNSLHGRHRLSRIY
jgi:hypothetical protein